MVDVCPGPLRLLLLVLAIIARGEQLKQNTHHDRDTIIIMDSHGLGEH
jgi:hypothetical protein